MPNSRTTSSFRVVVLVEEELVLGPFDVAQPLFRDPDHRTGDGEVEELLWIDLCEWLRRPAIDEMANGERRRLAGVVPAAEGGDERRVAKRREDRPRCGGSRSSHLHYRRGAIGLRFRR